MNCPRCLDTTLDVTFHGGIELDICPRCRGVWLDRGELERIARGFDEPISTPPTGLPRAEPFAPPPPALVADTRAKVDSPKKKSKKKSKKSKSNKKKSGKQRFADRLGDVFGEVLDQ